jgi:hypothetical protein
LGGGAFHGAALLLVTIGFVLLPAVAANTLRRQQRALSRVLVPMALVLFAMSFVHFGDSHALHPWTAELALHHAGIPLALYIVLQEYRFLLLDVFLRALANAILAGVFTLGWYGPTTSGARMRLPFPIIFTRVWRSWRPVPSSPFSPPCAVICQSGSRGECFAGQTWTTPSSSC